MMVRYRQQGASTWIETLYKHQAKDLVLTGQFQYETVYEFSGRLVYDGRVGVYSSLVKTRSPGKLFSIYILHFISAPMLIVTTYSEFLKIQKYNLFLLLQHCAALQSLIPTRWSVSFFAFSPQRIKELNSGGLFFLVTWSAYRCHFSYVIVNIRTCLLRQQCCAKCCSVWPRRLKLLRATLHAMFVKLYIQLRAILQRVSGLLTHLGVIILSYNDIRTGVEPKQMQHIAHDNFSIDCKSAVREIDRSVTFL